MRTTTLSAEGNEEVSTSMRSDSESWNRAAPRGRGATGLDLDPLVFAVAASSLEAQQVST
jgi:hypothetical protein